MDAKWILANLLRVIFLITSPVTLLVGLFLLYDLDTYKRLESLLGRTYNISKITIEGLEKNRESLQIFLVKRRRIVGFICIVNALIAIFISLFLFKAILYF